MAKSKCQPNLSNESSNSGSCSLLSVTGLSSDSSSYTVSLSKACNASSNGCSNSSSACPSSSSSSCLSSSSSSCLPSSSSCLSNSSSSLTYTSNDTNSTSVTQTSASSSCDSSTKKPCNDCDNDKNDCLDGVRCEKRNDDVCRKLVKQYKKSKDLLRANNDIIILLEFIKNKLIAVKPNIDIRDIKKYTIQENINWLETFVDTLFCVLRKNDAYKAIKVKDCKVKNNDVDRVSDRLYLIKAKFNNNCRIDCKTVEVMLYWSRLTFNDAKSFKGILDYTITEINNEITILKSENTQPFLQN